MLKLELTEEQRRLIIMSVEQSNFLSKEYLDNFGPDALTDKQWAAILQSIQDREEIASMMDGDDLGPRAPRFLCSEKVKLTLIKGGKL